MTEVTVSAHAAIINELADAAAEIPDDILNRTANTSDELQPLYVLRSLVTARKERLNIGDLLIKTLQDLREEAELN